MRDYIRVEVQKVDKEGHSQEKERMNQYLGERLYVNGKMEEVEQNKEISLSLRSTHSDFGMPK